MEEASSLHFEDIRKRRRDLAVEAAETLEAYRRGDVRRGPVEDLMKDLEDEE